MDADRCARFEWRERLPAGEVGVDWEDLVTPGDCYVVVPSVHLSLPGLPLGIGGAQELSWDGLGLCVNWVRFPTVQVLGVALSIDWFLLPAMVWFLNRILTL